MCSTQHNNKNELSMTQKETGKCSVHFETMAKHYNTLCDSNTRVLQGYLCLAPEDWRVLVQEFF